MNRPGKLHNISLRAKVLIPTITIMVCLLAATMFVVSLRFREQTFETAQRELEAAGQHFQAEQVRHLKYLQKRFQSLANEPVYRAAFESLDPPTVRDSMGRMIVDEGLGDEDVAFVFYAANQSPGSPAFKLVIRQGDPTLSEHTVMAESEPCVKPAMEGDSQTDTIGIDEKLYNVVCVPVYSADHNRILGALTFGETLGWKVAQEFGVSARGLTAIIAGNNVVASTLPGTESVTELTGRFKNLARQRNGTNSAIDRVVIGREHFYCSSGNFQSREGDKSLGYLLFTSYEEQLESLQTTELMLLLVSFTAIIIGAVVVWYFVRKATEPLRELRESAEAVGRGDFSQRVHARGNDECGQLAKVFNQMTENIEHSRLRLEQTVESLKSTQAQLIQSEKLSAVGEFVAGVAHELNNPLAAVMGFSELLKNAPVDAQYRRYLDMIFKASQRCQKIVQSLLSFARRHQPERNPVCLNHLVEEVLEIVAYSLRTSNVEVVAQLEANLPLVLADDHQIQQVLLNVLNNARQSIEGKTAAGKIKVVSKVAGQEVLVSIQDNGPGISKENLERIFDPFFTTKDVNKGTGLGLSICYGIIKEHGGSIVPSSKPGEGATFTITLPVFQAAGNINKLENKAETAANPDAGRGKKILLIDDEESLLEMMSEELKRHGYEVWTASDGETGLRQVKSQDFDLAFCDWKMPGVNGRQFYEQLRKDSPNFCRRVVFITGDVINESMRCFLDREKRPCLTKPFSLADFRAAIDSTVKAN
jgi:two-component system NtrC family sensor kinase